MMNIHRRINKIKQKYIDRSSINFLGVRILGPSFVLQIGFLTFSVTFYFLRIVTGISSPVNNKFDAVLRQGEKRQKVFQRYIRGESDNS